MAKYRIYWQLTPQHQMGEDIIEAESQEHADDAAYEALLQELDSEASYGAEEIEEDEGDLSSGT